MHNQVRMGVPHTRQEPPEIRGLSTFQPLAKRYEAALHTVLRISSVTLYGSQFALGRLSSM